ncbi:MAG: flagellar biosynthesis anti-sigma factor FlgM [Phycisphaerae bacterium]|nr:flagellar biosynthesis anti-sigma factor FlgM [Phycisphaerae bacterium]
MPDIGNISSSISPSFGYGSVGPLNRPATDSTTRVSHGSSTETSQRTENRDRVELSEHARWLDTLRSLPPIRAEKVAEIKAAIADGTYESDEKLNTVIDRLLEDIGGN